MLGLQDFSVFLALVISVVSMIIGILYGIKNWNREGELSDSELETESQWIKEEIELDEDISGGSL